MKNDIQTAENLFDDVLENAEYESMPALKWLEQGLCIDDVTASMDKSDLLKLLSKALLAVCILNKEKVDELERANKSYKFAEFAVGAALVKYDVVKKLVKTNMAKNSVNVKLENDPIQLAKKEIEKCYEASKSQFKRRGYSAQFIREMHIKYPIITDQNTIAKLVTKLNKTNEHIPRQLA